MFRSATLLLFLLGGPTVLVFGATDEWWRDTFIYQVYPRSFKDSDGNGVGDLNGITSKLEHFVDLGVSTVWLSPIYVSPMVDFGYDIANFTDVDPIFGTLDDFTELTKKAKALGLRVVLDFVPNHSSTNHTWFKNSVEGIKPYDEYYVWRDPKMVNGTRQPPNNWLSAFQGSAWEWNEQRKQYYLHQFAVGQADLNYRSQALNNEMKNALAFWIARGVDGFRIDAIPYMFEDERFLDEPVIPNTGLPPSDARTLQHIYTQDLPELYDVVKSWRQLVDALGGDKKVLLAEAYTSLPNTMKYYLAGVHIPMNFIFFGNLTNTSTNADFKKTFDRWFNNMPDGDYVANWVVDNHDNNRVSARFGTRRSDQLSMLATILPGVGIIYYGDEIGMENVPLTWNQTVDPAGCNAGPDRYHLFSRDPARTPFQWDDTTSAGFSTNSTTWLPVHSNYKMLNLKNQKMTNGTSHYHVFKKLVQIKKSIVLKYGTTEIILIGNNVLGVVRRLRGVGPIILLINFSENSVTVDASTWLNIPEELTVYVANVYSNISSGVKVNATALNLPGAASVMLME